MSVVTRFAPSPTGLLHIGGARTALFNWLFARRFGGRYLLRIEDTDRERSTPEAIEAILDGLDWLELGADDAPIFQFARADRHREAAEAMIARGHAFRCFVTPDELEARRARGEAARAAIEEAKKADAPPDQLQALKAEAETHTRAFRSPYRDGKTPPSADAPFVVRLRAPDEGEILNEDLVQGRVCVRACDIDDLVLLRADGTPTYMLAVVVDDHDMGVTHVIRGDDHLTNAARQIPIYAAAGWRPPAFAHIPLIHGPDGAKLSKRHGALSVQEYRKMGYLPEALRNYLMRLGWSHGDDEIMSMTQAAHWFDLDHVGRGPSRLDFAKLDHVNAHYLREADDARLATLTLDAIREGKDWALTPALEQRVAAAVPILKLRAKTIIEMAELAYFLVRPRPINLDAAAQKIMKAEARERLGRLSVALRTVALWSEEDLGAALKHFAGAEGVGMGQIGPPARAALTGGAPSPDLAQTFALLGREESLARIEDQVGGSNDPT